jgi:hypothetical protein
VVEFSVLGAKVEFLRGKSLNSTEDSVGEGEVGEGEVGEGEVGEGEVVEGEVVEDEVVEDEVVVVAVVVVMVAAVVVVVAAVVVGAAVVVVVVAVVVGEGFDGTLVGTVVGLVVAAVIVFKLFVEIEELAAGIVAFVLDSKVLDWPPKVVAFDTVLLIDSTGGVKASGGTVDTSRSTCCSVIDDIVVNMGSMTGRIVVFKSMC